MDIPLILSIISIVIAACALFDTLVIHRKQRYLIKSQQEQIDRNLELSKKATFSAEIVNEKSSKVKFTNIGTSPAYNVNIVIDKNNKFFYYFYHGGFAEQLPFTRIDPNEFFCIPANHVTNLSQKDKIVIITWDDDYKLNNSKVLNLNFLKFLSLKF